jgi:hypothetical protein
LNNFSSVKSAAINISAIVYQGNSDWQSSDQLHDCFQPIAQCPDNLPCRKDWNYPITAHLHGIFNCQ